MSDEAPDDPVSIPIEDSIDLHTFRAEDVEELLDDYLREAHRKGFSEVRIIHGKGKGMLLKRVHLILSKHPLVISFRQADPTAGGWGATLALLKEPPEAEESIGEWM